MSRHALEVLEFGRVLERVAARASSEPARERIRALRPSTVPEDARRELGRVAAAMRFADEKAGWGMPVVPDAGGALKGLIAEGAVLEPVQLHRLGILLHTSRDLAREMDGREEDYPELESVRLRLVQDRELEETLDRSVDADGNVLDTASRDLKKIRDRLRGAHSRVVRRLEQYLRGLDERFVVADASVTIREGRYVIPVRREGKGAVGGIIHDESQSGATLFVEPPVAIELMNQLRDLEREEQREVRRVLGELTGRLVPLRAELRGALEALVDFDALFARARTAAAWRASVPELLDDGPAGLELKGARHPLLLEAEDHPDVVPYDLSIGPGELALVISGPNTGGKSVFLKATGLIAALAQSGVVPPVQRGTRLPVFGSFFADIGDEQSIARSLSTFSAHLANLKTIVEEADNRSLVLIDEMGTGTDPAEGAALARAVLEELVDRGAFTVVSSHLGELKRLDEEGSAIVNASLQFDPDRMEPTYQLVKGRPGRSYGLAIARRLGFPGAVLDRAETYRSDEEAHLEELLGRLERREHEAERALHELENERARAARLQADLDARERTLSEAERTAERRAREDARRELMDARAEVEKAIEEVRTAADEGHDLEEASTRARRRVEEAARKRTVSSGDRDHGPAPDLDEGDRVRVRATGAKGKVIEVRNERAVVEVGALRLEMPAVDLEVLDALPDADAPRRGGGWTGPGVGGQARTEVDLRGLRVEEMEIELSRSLDQAVMEDLAELRIIHGKGTGALRQRVSELLKLDGRVQEYRMGGPTEGGAGVTVASFR